MRLARFAVLLSLAVVSPSLASSDEVAPVHVPEVLVQETRATGPAPELRPFQPLAGSAPKLDTGTAVSPEDKLPEPGAALFTTVQAVASKRWGLAVSGALLFLVLLLRKAGGNLVPALGTGKGAAWLTVAAGVLLTLFEVYQQGDPTLAVLVTAAASGFWSWAQSTGLVSLLASAFFQRSPEPGTVLPLK